MDKVVKDIEIAASQCGIESKKELISIASGFAARDAHGKESPSWRRRLTSQSTS